MCKKKKKDWEKSENTLQLICLQKTKLLDDGFTEMGWFFV